MYAQQQLANGRAHQQMNNSDSNRHNDSVLLESEENAGLEQAVGKKRTALTSAVAQLFLSHAPSGHKSWRKEGSGVVCFVKDRTLRSYVIRFFIPDMSPSGVAAMKEAQYIDDEGKVRKPVTQWTLLWEQELYTDIQYVEFLGSMFHMFEAEGAVAGLLFSEPSEAAAFYAAVMDKVNKISAARQRTAVAVGEAESYYSSPTHHTATTMIKNPQASLGRPIPARSNSATHIETADITPSKKPSTVYPAATIAPGLDHDQHLFLYNGQNIAMPNPISDRHSKKLPVTQQTLPVSGSSQRTSTNSSARPTILPGSKTSDDGLYYKPHPRKAATATTKSSKNSAKGKAKLTKADIGQPSNFQHLVHAGFSSGEMQVTRLSDVAQHDKKLSILLEQSGLKLAPGVSLDRKTERHLKREIDRLGGIDAVHNAFDQRQQHQQQQQVAYVGARQTSTVGGGRQPVVAPTPPPPYRDMASPLPSREQRATSTTKTVTPPATPTPPPSQLSQNSRSTTSKPAYFDNTDRVAGMKNVLAVHQTPEAAMGRSPPIPPRRSGGVTTGALVSQNLVQQAVSPPAAVSQPASKTASSSNAPPPPPPPPPPPAPPAMPAVKSSAEPAPPVPDGRSQLLAQIRGEAGVKPKLRPVDADKYATLPAKRVSGGGDGRDDLLKQIRSFGGENKQTLLKPVDPESVRNQPPIAGAAGVEGDTFDQMAEVLRRVLAERNQAMRGEDSEDERSSTSDSSDDWND